MTKAENANANGGLVDETRISGAIFMVGSLPQFPLALFLSLSQWFNVGQDIRIYVHATNSYIDKRIDI